jgi:uncharacterized protein YkwD
VARLLTIIVSLFLIAGCGDDAGECASEEACAVIDLVNEERENAGAPPLEYHPALEEAAQLHAEDMHAQNYFSHTSLDGRNFAVRASEAGYDGNPRGENIAAGQQTPEAVMQSWMSSPGHRTNILNPDFTEIGVGFEEGLWVQVFGSR